MTRPASGFPQWVLVDEGWGRKGARARLSRTAVSCDGSTASRPGGEETSGMRYAHVPYVSSRG